MFWYIVIAIISILLLVYFNARIYDKNPSYPEIVKKITRQAARWSEAAKQDQNPVIAILHANYGAGYLWALKDIVNAAEFNRITGLDLNYLENIIVGIQDQTTRRLVQQCPGIMPPENYLLQAIYGVN